MRKMHGQTTLKILNFFEVVFFVEYKITKMAVVGKFFLTSGSMAKQRSHLKQSSEI